MSLQPANGGGTDKSGEGGSGGIGGFGLDGEGLLRAAALNAAQSSGGTSTGFPEGALFGKKAASTDASEARGANGTPSTADHNGSGSKSSSSGTANLPQTSPDQNSMAPPPPPKAVAAKDGAGAVKLAKPVEPTRPPSTTGAAESVKGSVVGSVKGSGGKGAEGKSGEEEEEEDAEAPRGRRMRSSGMGGEIGGFTQMSWLRVPPPESARRRGRGGVTMSEVRQHRKLDDAWTVVRGKVYDITPYMRYHPGGSDMLMKGAGRDSSSLFNKYHAWVNVDFLLEKCFIGILVPE